MSSVAVLLTDVQSVAIRFHLGYGNQMSDDSTVAPYYRFAELEALDFKMNHLTANENARVSSQLTYIETAYTNWINAQANLSFASAAILTNRKDEMEARERFYIRLCQRLAQMIGVDYRGDGGDAMRVIV